MVAFIFALRYNLLCIDFYNGAEKNSLLQCAAFEQAVHMAG